MSKSISNWFKLALVIVMLVVPEKLAFASEKDENFNFQMNAVFPDNQINKNISYFDLKVEPEQEQTLSLDVSNTGKTTKRIKVEPVNSWTNQEGKIVYEPSSTNYATDKTLKYSFNTLFKEKSQLLVIKPGEKKEAKFTLQVPKTPFEGVILGAFSAKMVDEKEESTDSITNKMQIVKAVVLRENEKEEKPKFSINKVKPSIVDSQKAVTVNIQNMSPVIITDMKINAKVYKEKSLKNEQAKRIEKVQMAPNSNFDFPILFNTSNLEVGNYILKVSINYKNKTETFNKKFKINKNSLYQLENESDLISKKSNSFIYIYIIIFILLLFLIGYIFFYKKKKKKKKKIKRKNK